MSDDIYGDGVNVAARLEALAEPGGICVSRVVRDQVRDKLDFAFEDMGEQQVKNIARPVRVYRCRIAGAKSPAPAPPAGAPLPLPDKPSIAVLPFSQYERRPGAGIFRRRHGRGHHHRSVADQLAVRDRAQLDLYLQGPGGRREAGRARVGRALCARRQRAQSSATGCASPAS